ncbi:MAG: zinc ribbon domain-containing protein [Candidatus Thorarchaeota archaeon]|nr:MAG: zinc ribbon domain-containing protein [Candidatus Thorarchaeota archaeon]
MRIRSVAKVPTSANVYSVYVRQRLDARTQIFSLDYSDKLRVYDARGTLRSTRKWSSKVRCIAVADVEGVGKDSLVGGVGKKVLVVDHQGSPIWNIGLESSVVACDARDIDGDDAAEVVVALQNRRVILWNDDKNALFSRTMDRPVADVWLEDITNDTELEVVIADRKGVVTILTAAGYKLKDLQLGAALTTFAVLTFGERRLFVTGDHSSVLRIWDIDGNQITSLDIEAAPKAMATGIPDDVSDVAYLVVSTRDKRLSFWEVQETGKASKSEQVILQQIDSTKDAVYRRAIKCGNCGAPASPEAAKCESCGAQLEVLAEYVIEEYIQESIDSITSKHHRIELKELDRILRRTLPRPAAYNLRRSLQAMIQAGAIEGHIDGSTFVRTKKPRKRKLPRPNKQTIDKTMASIRDLLEGRETLDILRLEKETGIDRRILRRTLLILLGEGEIEGVFSEDTFTLDAGQEISQFIWKLEKELKAQ